MELKSKWEDKEKELIKVYDILLKKLSNTKKLVYKIERKEYYVGRDGISYKNSNWGFNTSNISQVKNIFKSGLKIVDENLSLFVKALSKSKQKKFKQFMQKAYLYYNSNPPLNQNIKPILIMSKCECGNFSEELIKNIKISLSPISILLNDSYNHNSLLNPRIGDFIIFEQLFNQIRYCLNKEIKNKKQDLDNITKYLNDLDLKFSDYIKSILTLRELNN